jgi:gas vesicle protein
MVLRAAQRSGSPPFQRRKAMTTEPDTTDAMAEVRENRDRNFGFVIGIVAGSAVGLGLGMLLAPRAVLELRRRAADSAKSLGKAASDKYRQASTGIGAAVEEITKKGQDLRDKLSDAVVRGAQEVERSAKNAGTEH